MAENPQSGARDGMNGRDGRDSRDIRPIPDPTAQTQILVDKAIDSLERILDERIKGMEKVYATRFEAGDQAVQLLQTIQDRMPAEIDVKISNLERLHNERFKGVDTRILERDAYRTEAKADVAVGITAALASAEKLVGQSNDSFREMFDKAEKATEKLLDKQDENQKTTSKGLEDRVVALKERVDRIEGAAVGAITAKADVMTGTTSDRGASAFNLSLVMAAVGIISLLVTMFVVFLR